MTQKQAPHVQQHVLLFQDAQKLHRIGRLDKALELYDRILGLRPEFGEARLARALVMQAQGKIRAAVDEARAGLDRIAAPTAGNWLNYGVVCKNAGLVEETLRAYEQARKLAPDMPAVKANLAALYLSLRRLDEAEQLCLELTESSEEPAPWLNLARIALLRNDVERVSRCVDKVSDLDPKNPDIPMLRAHVAFRLKDEPEACAQALTVLMTRPTHPEAWNVLLGLNPACLDPDRLEKVLEALAGAGSEQPFLLATAVDLCRHNLIWGPLPELEAQLARLLDGPQKIPLTVTACFSLLGCNVPQTAHRHAAEAAWRNHFHRQPLPPRELPPLEQAAPLRVGFLSSDLRGHAIGFLITGLLEKLPRGRIVWYAYNNSFSDNSAARDRLRSGFDRFVNVSSLNGEELAQRIREDRIDILIDLNGMTRDTRAGMLSFRAAPIQITWLGMPGTLGAGEAVDYILGDAWTTPLSLAEGFTEQIIQLPRSYQPNDHVPPDLSLAGGRAAHGLPEEATVFCCFNQHYKISPDTFALWGRILEAVPGSVLWLMVPRTRGQFDRLRAHAERHGIAPERVFLAKGLPQDRHIARISLADLVLDTLPYNAHTTCSDALRAGVPVLTLPGSTFAGRVAAGILDTAGLHEWIVEDEESYVRKAVAYGRLARAEMDAVKKAVHDTYWASPMPDNAAFARLLEQLCLGLYERHAAGLPPEALRLTPEGRLEPLSEDGSV